MRIDDSENYTYGEVTKPGEEASGDLWNYGLEKWCNMEGQYMTLVFDLSHFAEKSYEMSICSLGVMGAEYVRD